MGLLSIAAIKIDEAEGRDLVEVYQLRIERQFPDALNVYDDEATPTGTKAAILRAILIEHVAETRMNAVSLRRGHENRPARKALKADLQWDSEAD